MQGRRAIRGGRRPVVIDLLLSVAVASLLMAGLRATLDCELDTPGRLICWASLAAIPLIACLYGASAAFEMRRGWMGASVLSGLLHLALVLGSVAGISAMAVLCPMASAMLIAAETLVLLWASSWL